MTFIVPSNFRQLPPVWETAQPFSIDVNGAVAYDADPVLWARNHILAVLLTNPGERVMRPTYGAGIFNFVFDNADPLIEAQITSDIQNAISIWEPNITLHSLDFVPQPDFSGIAVLDIMFSIGTQPTPNKVSITLGGTGIEITARSS